MLKSTGGRAVAKDALDPGRWCPCHARRPGDHVHWGGAGTGSYWAVFHEMNTVVSATRSVVRRLRNP